MSARSTAQATIAILVCAATAGAALPGPTPADWELTRLDWAPNAPAVILERTGEMKLEQDSVSSYLEVYVRLKVLTQEGVGYGTISLLSSDFYRTKAIEGATRLPGGQTLDLAKDAVFEREFSDYFGTTVRSAALPGVVPGAIVEYRYRTYFDSIYHPASWFFQDRIPTLLSRINFYLPQGISFAPMVNKTIAALELEEESSSSARGTRASYTMRNVPAVPDEPDRFPFADLASRVKMLPITSHLGRAPTPLFESWRSVIDLAVGGGLGSYQSFLRKSSSAGSTARTVAASAGSDRERVEVVFRWVRDEVDDEDREGIWAGKREADTVFAERKGDSAEQALLLHAMLGAVKVGSKLAWTSPRHHGRIQPKIPDPTQLDVVLVAVELDGETVFLDPTDTSAGFGVLRPSLQGAAALLVDHKKRKLSEWTFIPMTPAERSTRTAWIELELDDDGVFSGHGRLELAGNHAWTRLRWRDTAERTSQAWKEWLEGRFAGYAISELEVVEDIEKQRVSVTWQTRQQPDEVLGDEADLSPARPLAVTSNPYTLPPERRLTPLQLGFPALDRVETVVTWPAGWSVDVVPPDTATSNSAGRLETTVVVDEDERRATVSRTLVISEHQYIGGAAYADLRNLYAAAVENDARPLMLVAE